MADIIGKFYSSRVIRRGVSPSNPGNIDGEEPVPVNPPSSGSGIPHEPVSIGSPANGLSIDPATQVLSIGLASSGVTGALSGTDWNTFNGKLNLTSPLTGFTVGTNTPISSANTILSAFQDVQGQINARVSGTIASGQVAFGTGVNTVGGDSGLTFTTGTNRILTLTGRLSIVGFGTSVFVGFGVGSNATVQTFNTAVGWNAMSGIVVAGFNTAIGGESLLALTSGSADSALGATSLRNLTTGSQNVANGRNTGLNYNGSNSVFIGESSGLNITSGDNNVVIGRTGARFLQDGSTAATSFSNGVYIGTSTRVGVASATNEIVIGHNAIGEGSNTTVIGNSSTTATRLYGTVRVNTINNLGSTATRFLVASATGVISERTGAELASDIGAFSEQTFQTVSTSGTITDLARTSNRIVFTGTDPTLNGMTNGASGRTVRILFAGTGTMTIGTGGSANNQFSPNATISLTTGQSIDCVYGQGNFWYVSYGGSTFLRINGSTFTVQNVISKVGINRTAIGGDGSLLVAPTAGSTKCIDVFNGSGTLTGFWDGSGAITVRGINVTDAFNIALGTTTGTRIGTATNQRLAFWNATPIVQPTTGVAAATLVSNAGTTLTSTDTFDGYTLQQIVRALRNTGLLA